MYSPLNPETDEIRLLCLHAGAPSDDIVCHLLHADLQRKTPYEALSYEWMSWKGTTPIRVDEQVVQVTLNLHAALKAPRYEKEDRVLWVDAVCINQGNVSERNHQVQMMRKIYMNAVRTVAWLGPAKNEASILWSYRISAKDEVMAWWLQKVRAIDDILGVTGLASNNSQGLDMWALWQLLERPYWSRIWVQQEVALAREVWLYCGSGNARWEDLIDVLTAINSDPGPKHWDCFGHTVDIIRFHRLLDLDYQQRARDHKKSIHWLRQQLRMHRLAQPTIPQDIVYALLGLFEGSALSVPRIVVDYDGSLFETYMQVFNLSVANEVESNRLNILTDAVLTKAKKDGIPSWLPDWNDTGRPKETLDSTCFEASCDIKPSFHLSDNLRVLTVTGVRAGTVELVQDTDIYDYHDGYKSGWVANVVNAGSEAWFRSLSSHISLKGMPPALNRRKFEETRVLGRSVCWQTRRIFDSGRTENVGFEVQRYLDEASHCSLGRRLAYSGSTGHMMVPESAEVGDEVCIIFGCSVPIVLRKQERGAYYTVIGACYASEIMQGEAVKDDYTDRLRHFELR